MSSRALKNSSSTAIIATMLVLFLVSAYVIVGVSAYKNTTTALVDPYEDRTVDREYCDEVVGVQSNGLYVVDGTTQLNTPEVERECMQLVRQY